MGATSRLRDRLRQPGTFAAERIPRRRESDPEDQVVGAVASFRPGTSHACGNRKPAWPQALRDVACVAKPDAILGWYRRLVAQKFDGSKHRQYPGRPPVSSEVEVLVVRMARENSGWGYDRIVGALANLGHPLSDQTVKNILRRHGIAPAPKRSQVTSWKDFLAAHMNVLAGCDFFRRPGVIFIPAAMCCTIATRSSALRFDQRWQAAA